MSEIIEKQYKIHVETPSDINEHLPTLKKYATECDTIYELGVRTVVSTWGLLAGYPKRLVSVDIVHPDTFGGSNTLELAFDGANEAGIDYSLVLGDTLKLEIPETDLLFIDTKHTYLQLKQELGLHAKNTKKYIILHDTVTFGNFLFTGEGGLNRAVKEFLSENQEWKIREVFTNNNGLTVLERQSNEPNGNRD